MKLSLPVGKTRDPIGAVHVESVSRDKNVLSPDIAKQLRQVQARIVADVGTLIYRNGGCQITSNRRNTNVEKSCHEDYFFTSCIVFTAVDRAVERSLAMGASGVAKRPTSKNTKGPCPVTAHPKYASPRDINIARILVPFL